MLKFIRIVFFSIALIYLGGMIYQVAYFAYFKINQDEIAAKHCVNKAKPEMHCNGQCHLKNQLENAQVFDKEGAQNDSNRLPSITLEVLIAVIPENSSDSLSESSELYVLEWADDEELCSQDLDTFIPPPEV